MQKYKKICRILCVALIFSILFLPIIQAAQKQSFFQRMKGKIKEKIVVVKEKIKVKSDQLEDKNWWKHKGIVSGIGFVAGKLGGAIGAGIGYLAGMAIGGPLAGGAGAVLGFRIGNSLTNVFGRALGEIIARAKVKDKKKITTQSFFDAIKSMNFKKVSAEGVGAVFGDLVGGTLGATLGIAVLAGTGAWAIPILGTVSAAYLGGKLGKSIGRGIGKWIGKKVLKQSYTSASKYVDDKNKDEEQGIQEETSSNATTATSEAHSSPQTSYGSDDKSLEDKKIAYEEAYKEYVQLSANQSVSPSEIQQSILKYREAYDVYTSSVKSAQIK